MIDFVIGCGQGGARIGKRLSQVFGTPSAYLNLTSVDFSKMFSSEDNMKGRTLVLEEGGTGRDPKAGEKKVKSRFSEVKDFLGKMEKFAQAEYVVVVVGGGGGSGSGFLFPLIDWLSNRKQVLVVFTIPENREGVPAKPNAYVTFDRLLRLHCTRESEKPVSLLVVDNEYGIRRYGRGEDSYWGDVNEGLVNALRRFHNLTNLERGKNYMDMASGYKAIDQSDLRSILFSKGGILDIRELAFEAMDSTDLVKNIRSSSLVFGGLDTRTTKRYLVSIGIPEDWRGRRGLSDFIEMLFDTIARQSRHTPYVLRSTYYNTRLKRLRVHLLMAGLTESKSMAKMKRSIIRDMDRLKSKEDTHGLDMEGLEEFV